mmetsp:Transcript_18561/g.23526  ORF Transcript_18561/g.23526 Transcript_18561/m.23526 type:complete len:210 (+) Transcript_18561:763-1392(+)
MSLSLPHKFCSVGKIFLNLLSTMASDFFACTKLFSYFDISWIKLELARWDAGNTHWLPCWERICVSSSSSSFKILRHSESKAPASLAYLLFVSRADFNRSAPPIFLSCSARERIASGIPCGFSNACNAPGRFSEDKVPLARRSFSSTIAEIPWTRWLTLVLYTLAVSCTTREIKPRNGSSLGSKGGGLNAMAETIDFFSKGGSSRGTSS